MVFRCIRRIRSEQRLIGIFSLLYLGSMMYLIVSQNSQGAGDEFDAEIIGVEGRIRELKDSATYLRNAETNKQQHHISQRSVQRPANSFQRLKANQNPGNPLPGPHKLSTKLTANSSIKVNNSLANHDCNSIPKPKFLQPGRLPLTALASFPGSGNTWARILFSSLTGYNTGDVYRDGSFSKTPGFSIKKDDTVIAVKTHHPFWDDNNGPDPQAPRGRYWERAIVILRHPLEATVSGYNWVKTKGSHMKTAPETAYFSKDGNLTQDWTVWAHNQIRNWGRCLYYWVNQFKGPVLIVVYEDLQQNLEQELLTINEFLGLPLQQERLYCTMVSNAQTQFKREKHLDKRKVYDTLMLNEVEAVLKSVHLMLATNYTHPVTSDPFDLPANYGVEMVRENFSLKPI